MNTFSQTQPPPLPTSEGLLAMDGSRAYALAHAVKSVRLALAGEPDIGLLNADAQHEIHLHHPNRWATKMSGIKSLYNKWMDEDAHMYECIALTSWERQ